MTESATDGAPDMVRADAHAVLFGYPPSSVDATLRPRARSWRIGGAARAIAVALLVAPAVAVVPPHAPWVIGVLATGALLARRRWNERFTVMSVVGACPRCGSGYEIKPGPLRRPHPLPCEECHHESMLQLPDVILESGGAETV